MSGTETAPKVSSGSTSTQSSAAASGGVAGAVGVILVWGLGLAKITVPPEVALAFLVVLAPVVHWLALKMGAGSPTPENKGP